MFDNAQQASGYLTKDPINDIDLIVDNLKSPNDYIVRYLNPIDATPERVATLRRRRVRRDRTFPPKLVAEVNGGRAR